MALRYEELAEDNAVDKKPPPSNLPGVSPRAGGNVRSSQQVVAGPSAALALTGLYNAYAPLAYMLPFQALDYIELVAQYNPDYSQAIDNIKTLANSGYNIIVLGASRQVKNTHNLLEQKEKSINYSHGGVPGLIDKLLQQAATFGAMCGEWILSDDLKDVVDFADVSPKLIRFFFEDNHWAPYQKVSYFQLQEAITTGQKVRNNAYVKLNELTFHYFAFNSAPQSPYGVPPFLAALPHIATQQDMLFNMSQVVKKVGMLGIVDIAIQQMTRLPGETQEQFKTRAVEYVQEYANVMEGMMSQGGIAHFDDATVKATSITGNAAGATNIFKQNEELLFSGLKSMPSVQGRSYSTTETYAGVAYDIIIRNTRKYQQAAKAMIEAGFMLCANLNGLTPEKVTLDFRPNKTLQRLEEARAHQFEILNSIMLWVLGLTDQTGVAHMLGMGDPVKPMDEAPTDDPIFGSKPGAPKEEGTNPAGNPAGGRGGGENPPPAGHMPALDEAAVEDMRQEMWAHFEEMWPTLMETHFPELTAR